MKRADRQAPIQHIPLWVNVLRFVPGTSNRMYEHHLHLGVGFENRSTFTRVRHRVLRFPPDIIILQCSILIRSAPTQYNPAICALLGFYAALIRSLLPMCAYPWSWDRQVVPNRRQDYQSTSRKIQEDRSHLCCGGCLKSRHITLTTDSAVKKKTSRHHHLTERSTNEEKRRRMKKKKKLKMKEERKPNQGLNKSKNNKKDIMIAEEKVER
jgi:hypothetical protein